MPLCRPRPKTSILVKAMMPAVSRASITCSSRSGLITQRTIFMDILLAGGAWLAKGRDSEFVRADAHGLGDFGDEDLAVADGAGPVRPDQGVHRGLNLVVLHHDDEQPFREQTDAALALTAPQALLLAASAGPMPGHGEEAGFP